MAIGDFPKRGILVRDVISFFGFYRTPRILLFFCDEFIASFSPWIFSAASCLRTSSPALIPHSFFSGAPYPRGHGTWSARSPTRGSGFCAIPTNHGRIRLDPRLRNACSVKRRQGLCPHPCADYRGTHPITLLVRLPLIQPVVVALLVAGALLLLRGLVFWGRYREVLHAAASPRLQVPKR